MDAPADFPRLPGSPREIAAIVKMASGWATDVLVRERATKAAVLSEPLDRFRILHFATHARLDVRDPQLSAIVLSGPRARSAGTESALTLREIAGMDLNADAVVLSACEGSLGKDYRGQLSFGLSEAFLLAGSRNVLGSLWRVSDAATERYMRAFYELYLRGELTTAGAAQAAARTMMRDPVFGHPYFWAAFVVLGG
jgi:CHAT domain-containing protein